MAYVRDRVDELIAQAPAVRIDAPDAVHQMRVAARKLRSAFATYRAYIDRDLADAVRDELKWLGEVLGRARDAEVQRARLLAAARALPPELTLGPVADRIDTEMRRRHADAHGEVVRVLAEPRCAALIELLGQLVESPSLLPPASDEASTLTRPVRRACRRVDQAAARLDRVATADDRVEALHDLRKAAKRARYAAESVKVVFGRSALVLGTRMEDLQDLLGEHQDSVSARPVLRELGVIAHLSGENGFTFGLLHGLEAQRSDHTLADLDRVYERSAARAVRAFLH